jgi:hypothetical protein
LTISIYSGLGEEHILVRPLLSLPAFKNLLGHPVLRSFKIILKLRDSGNAFIAYFYFDFRDSDKQRLRNMLPSLFIQPSAGSDSRCDTLSRLYSDHGSDVQKPSDRTMTECLKTMLTAPSQDPTYNKREQQNWLRRSKWQ